MILLYIQDMRKREREAFVAASVTSVMYQSNNQGLCILKAFLIHFALYIEGTTLTLG